MALVMVLVFTAALMVYGTALLSYAANEKQVTNYYCQDPEKYYIAEAGIEAGFSALQNDFYYEQEIKGFIGAGSFIVNFEDVDEYRRLIISEGTLKEYSLELRAVALYDQASGPIIIKWQAPY